MEIPLDLWSRQGGTFAFVVAFCGTLLLYPIATYVYLLGFEQGLPPLILVLAFLLAVMTGIFVFYFAASGWLFSRYGAVSILVPILLNFTFTVILCGALTGIFWGIPVGLISGMSLFPLILGSFWGTRFGDRERITRLAATLKDLLGSGKTLDLNQLGWLNDKEESFRFAWKLRLLRAAAGKIGYHITSTSILAPIK